MKFLAVFALVFAPAAFAAMGCPEDPNLNGIDVSKWQGSVDWDAVANDGIDFAFIRVNHGLEDIDELFDENWQGARNAGVARGAYQYFLINEDPVVQAELMLERLGTLEFGDLPPVIDVEDRVEVGPENYRAAVWAWIDVVEARLGVRPIIYSGQWFWEHYLGGTTEFHDAGYTFWFANYATCPTLPQGWPEWTIWQNSESGTVAGISGPVDTDVFDGDASDLAALGVDAQVCGSCAPCEAVDVTGGIIDELGGCATFTGAPELFIWSGDSGHGGALRWAFSATSRSVSASYELKVPVSGTWRVEVFTDLAHAEAERAPYTLRSGSDEQLSRLDQGAGHGFRLLAELRIEADDGAVLSVANDTTISGQKLVFDAVRLTPVTLDTEPVPEPEAPEAEPEPFEPEVETPPSQQVLIVRDAVTGGCTSSAPGAPLVVVLFAIRARRRRGP